MIDEQYHLSGAKNRAKQRSDVDLCTSSYLQPWKVMFLPNVNYGRTNMFFSVCLFLHGSKKNTMEKRSFFSAIYFKSVTFSIVVSKLATYNRNTSSKPLPSWLLTSQTMLKLQCLECLRLKIHIPVTAYNWWCNHDRLILRTYQIWTERSFFLDQRWLLWWCYGHETCMNKRQYWVDIL